ncbi:MAG: hypothetical protein ACRD1K_11745 [Acidimicrobiales bacterium]
MAQHDGDVATQGATEDTKRRRGKRRPPNASSTPPVTNPGPEPGVMKLLWADLRGRRIPRQPTADELAWEAEEEAAELAARGGVTGLNEEQMRRISDRSMQR